MNRNRKKAAAATLAAGMAVVLGAGTVMAAASTGDNGLQKEETVYVNTTAGGEVGVELPARIGIDQQVVRHVLVADLPGEMEHREGVAEVEPFVERVAACRDDAEHFARLLGVHALPVDGHFHIGVPAFRGFVVPQKTRKAVVVERRRIPEESQRVVAQQLFAVEDSGVGLHVPAVELVVG